MTDDALAPVLQRLSISRYDGVAWDDLYKLLWPVIVANISRTHRVAALSADDLGQEVMIRLLKHARFSGVSPAQFRSFVSTVCRNVAIDHLRRSKAQGQALSLDEIGVELPSLASGPSRLSEQDDLSLSQFEWLPDLSESDRKLLEGILSGQAASDLANELHSTVGTVYVWVHRLRRRLREALQAREEAPRRTSRI